MRQDRRRALTDWGVGMAEVPLRPEAVTTEWLSDVLGAEVKSFSSEQIGLGVGLLGRLFRLTLETNGDGPKSVVAKFPTVDENARMHVIEPMNFYEKEIRFYEQAATDTPIGTPRVYCSHFDPSSRDFVLLLEDLSDRRMEDQVVGCQSVDALTAVNTLIDLHAHWWEDPKLDSLAWLPKLADPPYPQVIAGMFKQAWPRALEILGDQINATYRDYGDRYGELVAWFCEKGTEPPVTFVHADYRLDNLFFANGHDEPLTVVDWQLSFRGRAGYDVAYFLSQSLTTDARRGCEKELKDAYHDGLASRGVDYPKDEFEQDYRRTVAFCFCYPIIAGGQIEFTNDRGRELVSDMLDRSIRAIEDNNALDILP